MQSGSFKSQFHDSGSFMMMRLHAAATMPSLRSASGPVSCTYTKADAQQSIKFTQVHI